MENGRECGRPPPFCLQNPGPRRPVFFAIDFILFYLRPILRRRRNIPFRMAPRLAAQQNSGPDWPHGLQTAAYKRWLKTTGGRSAELRAESGEQQKHEGGGRRAEVSKKSKFPSPCAPWLKSQKTKPRNEKPQGGGANAAQGNALGGAQHKPTPAL